MVLTTIALAMRMKPVRILPLGQTHVVVVIFVVGTASSDSSTISCGSVLPAVPGYSRGHRLEQASLRAIGVRITITKRGVVSGAGRTRSQLLHLPHILCTTSGALNGFRGIASLSGDQVLGVENVPVVGRWAGGWWEKVVGLSHLLKGLVGGWGGGWWWMQKGVKITSS